MIDPLIARLVTTTFGALWLVAAAHKLAEGARFGATLADYRLLPRALIAPVARMLPWLEGVLGLAWLTAFVLPILVPATDALLGIYTAAIAINLARGRTNISCGCGWSPGGGESSLSWWPVLRNLGLIVLSTAALLPVASRPLGAADFGVIVVTLLAAALLLLAIGQLRRNSAAMIGNMRHE